MKLGSREKLSFAAKEERENSESDEIMKRADVVCPPKQNRNTGKERSLSSSWF